MRHVIVGNSAAAVGAIEAIRQYDRENAITVVADEPQHVYARPLISHLLGGHLDDSRMYYRPADFYDRYQVEAMLGIEVTRVVTAERQLALAGGGTLAYDRLLISTGGRPFVPSLPGADLDGVFTFTRWTDARHIERYLKKYHVESVVVVGGGLIGLKTTEALMERHVRVTIVELADRILSISFDRTASRMAEMLLRRAGTEIRTGTSAVEITERDGRVDSVVLRDGERIECDAVVFAIGVRPNVGLVTPDSGIQVKRGIVVDRRMHTTVPDVWAAGDCVEAYDLLLGVDRPIAIWPNAYRQGHVAGSNMAGTEREYAGSFPMNSVEVCGVPTISVGLTDPQEDPESYETLVYIDRDAPTYKKLVMRDNRLVGAICVGNIDRAGIYTGLIRARTDITAFKDHLLSGNFGMISLPKEYRGDFVVTKEIEM